MFLSSVKSAVPVTFDFLLAGQMRADEEEKVQFEVLMPADELRSSSSLRPCYLVSDKSRGVTV